MQTSKLKLRPFIPTGMVATGDKEADEKRRAQLKDMNNTKREQFATLSYGNVTIELDYTIFIRLSLDVGRTYDRERAIFQLGKDEILAEMEINRKGLDKPHETVWFRDNPAKCSITHPYSPLCRKEDNWTSLIDGSRNMEWEKNTPKDEAERKDGNDGGDGSQYKDIELGNMLFGNSRGRFALPRDIYEESFRAFLMDGGFDTYGRPCDMGKANKNWKEDGGDCRFENEVFVLRAYYWGNDEKVSRLPNFLHKPSGYEIRWYKYPLRDSYASQKLEIGDFNKILNECLSSIGCLPF